MTPASRAATSRVDNDAGRYAHRARTRPRHYRARAALECLGPDDVGASDLVVPALLVGVECGPDDTDEDARDGDDQSDVTDERLKDRQRRSVGPYDFDIQHAHPERLPATLRRPEVAEVQNADQRLDRAPARVERIGTRVDETSDDVRHDADTYAVDEDREESDPEARFVRGYRDRRRFSSHRQGPPSAVRSLDSLAKCS